MARPAILCEQISNEVRNRIIAGEFPDNLKLPTEDVLAERFSVSKSVVRAALAKLRDEGLVKTVRGSGSFVITPKSYLTNVPKALSGLPDLIQCQETRFIVEGELAALAAERRTDSDINNIEQTIENVIKMKDNIGSSESDLDFHIAVIRAAKNDYALSLYMSMRPQVMFIIQLSRNLLPLMPESRMNNVIYEHSLVLDAIKNRDPNLARTCMRNHIDFFRSALKDGNKW